LRGRKTKSRLYVLHGDESAATDTFKTFRDLHDAAILMALEQRADARAALRACADNPLSTRCRKLYQMLEDRTAVRDQEMSIGG
jgi:hypothetical protein